MKKVFMVCVLLATALCTHAYTVKATVSVEKKTKWHIEFELENNDEDFTACQMDITLDSDQNLSGNSLKRDSLMRNHKLQLLGQNGHYHLMGYNMDNRILRGKEGALFSFSLEGNVKSLTINNVCFVRKGLTSVAPDAPADKTKKGGADKKSQEAQNECETVYIKKGKQVYTIDSRGLCIRYGKK